VISLTTGIIWTLTGTDRPDGHGHQMNFKV
jgi:hypothetical protein